MSEIITIARPYAKAIFDFAVENQSIEKLKSMLIFTSLVICNEHIANLLSASISPQELAKMLISICGDKINENIQNLIRIMAEYRRLIVLPEVLDQFIKLHDILESIIKVDVISSTELNEEQLSKISALMEKRLSCIVKLNCKIDKSVIAGVIIYTEDFVIDESIQSRLERLTDFLES